MWKLLNLFKKKKNTTSINNNNNNTKDNQPNDGFTSEPKFNLPTSSLYYTDILYRNNAIDYRYYYGKQIGNGKNFRSIIKINNEDCRSKCLNKIDY